MKRFAPAIAAILLLATAPTKSLCADYDPLLAKSSWLTDPHGKTHGYELHGLAYDWIHLLNGYETAVDLNRELWTPDKQTGLIENVNLAKKTSMIAGSLEEVVLGSLDRTLPLLRKYPDKVLTQALLLHSIRYNGGANERWPPIIESLCLLNEDWTVEAFRELTPEECKSLPFIVIAPDLNEEPDETDQKILNLLAKAKKS